jgi:hypothetical protein
METDQPEWMSFDEVAARSGLPRRNLRQRLDDSNVPVFQDARDRRRHLVRADDLARLTQPTVVRHLVTAPV